MPHSVVKVYCNSTRHYMPLRITCQRCSCGSNPVVGRHGLHVLRLGSREIAAPQRVGLAVIKSHSKVLLIMCSSEGHEWSEYAFRSDNQRSAAAHDGTMDCARRRMCGHELLASRHLKKFQIAVLRCMAVFVCSASSKPSGVVAGTLRTLGAQWEVRSSGTANGDFTKDANSGFLEFRSSRV